MDIREFKFQQTDTTWLETGLLALIIILHEIPVIPKILGGNPTIVPFMMLFLGLIFIRRKIRIRKKNLLFAFAMIVFASFQILYKVVHISTTGIGMYVNMVAFFFFFAAMYTVVERASMQQKLFLFAVIVTSMCFTIGENALMYHRYGFDYFMAIAEKDGVRSNATNTAYSTAAMVMAGWVLIAILHDKKRRLLWIGLFCILNAFNLFIAQRAITLLLSVSMYALIWVFSRKRKLTVVILVIAAALIVLLLYVNYPVVISFVSNVIGSERIAYKLSQIQRALDNKDISRGGGSLTARYELYMLSLKTWLTNPRTFLFGVGEHWDSYKQIGNHSQFLDVLGQYGITGSVFFYYCVYKAIKELLSFYSVHKSEPIFKQIVVVCVIFLIRGTIGHVLYGTIGIQLFIMLPIILSIIKEKEIIGNDSINVRLWVNGI